MGYYIRAKLYWSKQQDDPDIVEQTIEHVRQILSSHMELIFSNDWKGLPELTNADGHNYARNHVWFKLGLQRHF